MTEAFALPRPNEPRTPTLLVNAASEPESRIQRANTIPLQLLSEPRAGKARALNRALRAARGELLAFTDDDCRLHPQHVNDLLRYDANDTNLVLRGGRTELGDPTDLP